MMKTEYEISTLKKSVISGISLLLVREVFLKIAAILGQLILVRIIAPEYFGVYAIISFIVSIADFAISLGISSAIIQAKKEITSVQITTLVLLLEGLGLVAVIALYLLTPVFISFYPALRDQNYYLITLLSLTLLLLPIQTILISLLDKELKYDAIAKIDAIGIVIYYVVVIFLALNNFAILSFIYAVIAKEIGELVVSMYYKRVKFVFEFRFGEVRNLLKYGFSVQIGGGILLLHNSLTPLIGGSFGAQSMGYLDWGRKITSVPNTLLDNYGRAAFAGISLIQDRAELVSKAINKSIQFLNIAIFFFGVLLFTYTYDFIHFVTTDKWLPSIPALQWFLLGSLFSGVITALGQGLVAIGKAKELATLAFILVIIELLIALVFSFYFGFVGISLAFFLHAVLQFFCYTFLAKKQNISLVFLKSLANSILIFISCYLIGQILNGLLSISFENYIIKLALTAFSYLFLYYLLSSAEVLELLNIGWKLVVKK